MRTLKEILWRLLATARRRPLERETRDEMRFHLQMEIEAGVARGLSRAEAERQARLRAGTISAALEAVQDERGLGPFDGMLADLRHACAALRRQPGFALVACGTLALAVAMTTLVVAVVDGVLLRPLPYLAPDRLIRVFEWSKRNPTWPVSIGNYLEFRRSNRTLDGIALYTRDDVQLMHGNRPERLTAVSITDNFFSTLGVNPALGRSFTRGDLRRSARVVILSHRLWSSRFNLDAGIVGKTVRLDQEAWTVVGVMPEGFQHIGGAYRSPLQGDTVALWRPLATDLPEQGLRNWHFCNVVARVKAGVTVQQADGDLNRLMAELAKQFPGPNAGTRIEVVRLADAVAGSSRATVRLLIVAGVLVLLVAGVNVAGLCVARVLARRRELAIRLALGARCWRLVRAVLSENLVVGVAGGAAGLALAAALLPLLRAMMPAGFPRVHEVRLSATAVLFALVSSLAVSLAAGLVAALRQVGQRAGDGLAEDNRVASAARGARRLRAALVVSEVTIACLLCVGTTLLVRSAVRLSARDHGFDPSRVLTFSLTLPATHYDKPELAPPLFDALVRGWKQLPGVHAAGIATNLPWTGYDENTSFDVVGRPPAAGDNPQARFQAATPGFFAALRIRLLRGRLIDERDGPNAPPVVVVNDTLARRYFAGIDPVGQRVDIWGDKREIVGVLNDVRDYPADAGAEPAFWWPLAQQPFRAVQVALRTDGDPLSLAGPASDVLRRFDRELPAAEVRTLEDIAGEALGERRFALWLFQAFAALALALAACGIYGMLAYDVQQRRRELGIRMALGATRSRVAGMVLSHAAWLCGAGIALGVTVAPAAMRMLSSLLFGVTSGDPASLLIAPAILVAVALVSGLVPAWIGSRAEAVTALREQ
jgi:macrolide transport system ATP-binding/permease protein